MERQFLLFMLKETEYNFYYKLKKQSVHKTEVPKTVINSDVFSNLVNSGIVGKEKVGRGHIYQIVKPSDFEKFLSSAFPNPGISVNNKSDNIAKFRDSKATITEGKRIIFLRGFENVRVNKQEINLAQYIKNFGLFAVELKSLETPKICFVENLDSFLEAEKIIKDGFIFLHAYGRIGSELIKSINAVEALIFSDYDFVGLNEYLKFKSHFPNAKFFIPDNYDFLFQKFSKPLKKKDEGQQKPSEAVKNSTDEIVVKIREQVLRTNHFLEQQIVIREINEN